MAYLVIATAGHVDHGKSTLIKALTGMETDTTREEKERGLSINLGFAYMDLQGGQRVGIVDVPGHERFIKNMVAGLPGINLVLLVIDAGEGVMPQTREHVDILTLLGIRDFLIVLTKVSTVDEDMKTLVMEDIREQLAGTMLAEAEIMETDAISGIGIDALKLKIQQWAESHPQADENGMARMNVDRVFSVKGFGTVVTGTLLDGPLAVGDELIVYPCMKKTRVRNIQIHEQNVKIARARHRTALNLTNISRDEIQRGDVVFASSALRGTWMIDVKVKCLKNSPITIGLWERVRLLIGTREVMGRTVPIGNEVIEPGCEGFLQLRLEEEIAVKNGDHFILRSYSPLHTIGGGEILDAAPHKHRRFHQDVLDSLRTKEAGSIEDVTADFLAHKKTPFALLADIADYVRLPQTEAEEAMVSLVAKGTVIKTVSGYIHHDVYKKIRSRILQTLLIYHQKYPLRKGMPLEEFRSRLRKDVTEKDIVALTELLVHDNCCRIDESCVAAAKFRISLSAEQEKEKKQLMNMLKQGGFTPVKLDELEHIGTDVGDIARTFKGEGIVFLTSEYIIAADQYRQALDKIYNYIQTNGKMTLGDFRDITNSSRKSSMLILEYVDAQEFTKRVDNYRVLGRAASGYVAADR